MDAAEAGLVPFAVGRNCRCECVSEAVTVSEVSVSKVCVQADRDGDPVAVDLVLPSGTQLAELLPSSAIYHCQIFNLASRIIHVRRPA